MPDGFVVKAPFVIDVSHASYNKTRISYQVELRVCDDDIAPELNNLTSMESKARH